MSGTSRSKSRAKFQCWPGVLPFDMTNAYTNASTPGAILSFNLFQDFQDPFGIYRTGCGAEVHFIFSSIIKIPGNLHIL